MSEESDGVAPAQESPPQPPAPSPRPRQSGARTSSSRSPRPAAKGTKPPEEERPNAKPARPAASGAAKAAAAKSGGSRTPRATTPKPAGAAKPATTRKPAAAKTLAPKSRTGPTPIVAEPIILDQAVLEADVAPMPTAAPEPVLEPVPEPIPESAPESAPRPAPISSAPAAAEPVLALESLTKRFGDHVAVDGVTLSLDPGTFTGIVGPNGAGKTTTLSMITGLLRPTSGRVLVAGIDVWRQPTRAKRQIGVLPDRLHTFDRLTGGQLLYYTGVLHGLDRATARRRTAELAEAFKVEHAMGRLVTDYSSGMLKKIALAAALIHAPRLLVLDEPFESVDPVSAMTVAQILRDFAAAGGTVLMSSHSMELVQRICDHVAVIVEGRLIAGGTVDEVRGDRSLQERFLDLAGADSESIADLTWLHRFSG